MNEKFLELPIEKQRRILNAGMKWFGQYGYKNTSTEDIAREAGISKGLLFYYFHNKKSFYLYLIEDCLAILKRYINFEELYAITDFFEIIEYGARKKLEMIRDYPYMTAFILNAYHASSQPVDQDVNQLISKVTETSFDVYFSRIDLTRFKAGVDPRQIYRMLVWMADGYLVEVQRQGRPYQVEEMMREFDVWKEMFKKMCYEEAEVCM